MPVELSNLVADCNRAHGALAEIRASHAEFQAFFSGVFDGLEQLYDELLAHEIKHDRYDYCTRHAPRDAGPHAEREEYVVNREASGTP